MGAPEPQAGTGPAIPSASSVATASIEFAGFSSLFLWLVLNLRRPHESLDKAVCPLIQYTARNVRLDPFLHFGLLRPVARMRQDYGLF